jgi:hypothetical protein
VTDDSVANRHRQIQALSVALERVNHAQRVLVVQERRPEAVAQTSIERVFADVAERRMAEIVAEPDRLNQVLVQRQRAGDCARDLCYLERVRQPGAVVVARRRHEHLSLVRQAAESLGVHDPVAIPLKRRPQAAVGLRAQALRRVGTCGPGRQPVLLTVADALLVGLGDRAARML